MKTLQNAGNTLHGGSSLSINLAQVHLARSSGLSLQFVTTLPKNANKEIVLDLLAAVLPPPNLQFLILMWLNGVELRNRLVGMDNGFYLRIEVTGNHRLGKEILMKLLLLIYTDTTTNATASCQDELSFWDAGA